MPNIPQVDSRQDLHLVYETMVRIYGSEIYLEPRRALGCFADMAPRMDREYDLFALALRNRLPEMLFSGNLNEKILTERGKRAEEILVRQGAEMEEAIELIENLGRSFNLEIRIRPDYSQGGKIPYETERSNQIRDALDSMNHIRWFLNHESHYQGLGGRKELTEMRTLMGSPAKNRDRIEDLYKSLLSQFQNNPYEAHILLEGEKKASALSSDHFGDYLLSIGGEPVPAAFARVHEGREVNEALSAFSEKKQSFERQLGNLKKGVSSGDGSTDKLLLARRMASKGWKFIFWSLLFLAAFLFSAYRQLSAASPIPFFNLIQAAGFAPGRILTAVRSMEYGTEYALVCLISFIGAILGIFLLFSVLRTFVRSRKNGGGAAALERKKQRAEKVLSDEIPSVLDQFEAQMSQYMAGNLKEVVFQTYDFRKVIKAGQEQKKIELRNPVTRSGIRLRRGMAVLTVVSLLFLRESSFSRLVYGAEEAAALYGGSVSGRSEMSEGSASSPVSYLESLQKKILGSDSDQKAPEDAAIDPSAGPLERVPDGENLSPEQDQDKGQSQEQDPDADASADEPPASDSWTVLEDGGGPEAGPEAEIENQGLTEEAGADLSRFGRITIRDAFNSSCVQTSTAASFTAWQAVDGDPETSWQEGVEGDGKGEYIQLTFDGEYQINYVKLLLGKWGADGFYVNNRPSRLSFSINGQDYLFHFPDEEREFILRFDNPPKASEVRVTIDGSYSGSQWDDTCITDLSFYSVSPDTINVEQLAEEGRVTSSEYIFPDSDSSYLTEEDVASLSIREVNYAKNEIYARHGRLFQSPELSAYFAGKSWYNGSIPGEAFPADILNDYEVYNAEFLSNVEFRMNPDGYQLDQ